MTGTVKGYLMGSSLALPADPQAAPVLNVFRWATVIDDVPLTIQLDGDSLPLSVEPDCLVDPLTLGPGDRVWTQIYGRKVIVHGAQGGGTGSHTLPNEQVVEMIPSITGSTNSISPVDWPNAGGGPLDVTHVKRRASSVIVASFTASGWAALGALVVYSVQVDSGTDYFIFRGYHNTSNDHRQWAAQREIHDLAAGSHLYRLRISGNGVGLAFDYNDTFSLSIREVAP